MVMFCAVKRQIWVHFLQFIRNLDS